MDLDSKNIWITLLELNWFYDVLELDLKSTQTTLLDFNWFCDILDLENTWTNLVDSDLIYYNQAGMLLENLLKLSIKQLVIQSSLAKFDFPSLNYVWCSKNQNVNIVRSKVRYFSYSAKVIQVLPETLKYWVGFQRGQSYLMGRRCLFSRGWPPF